MPIRKSLAAPDANRDGPDSPAAATPPTVAGSFEPYKCVRSGGSKGKR